MSPIADLHLPTGSTKVGSPRSLEEWPSQSVSLAFAVCHAGGRGRGLGHVSVDRPITQEGEKTAEEEEKAATLGVMRGQF